jgi:integrase
VIRSFYEYHREMHGRPLVNPFPATKGGDEERLNAHHNPMQPFRSPSRRGTYQPKEPKPAPRSIPDQAFNDLFAALDCNRDRALVAFYISTGARASELLGVCQGLVAPEDQVIGVVRKGSRALPASDAHYCGSTRLKCRGWKGSTPTSSTDCGKPKCRAGWARSPRSRPP